MEHLSSSGGRSCWYNTSNSDRAAGLLKMAVNDTSEISFGSITIQIKSYAKIGLTNAGGVSQVRFKVDLSCGFDTGCKSKNTKQVEGILHKLSEEMRVSLVKMYIEYALESRAYDQLAMYKQQNANRSK